MHVQLHPPFRTLLAFDQALSVLRLPVSITRVDAVGPTRASVDSTAPEFDGIMTPVRRPSAGALS